MKDNVFRRMPDGTLLHVPPNELQRIKSIYAFVSVDQDGHEGVCAVPIGSLGPVPMIAADEKRLRQLTPLAEKLARDARIRIRLIRLTTREEVRTIDP